MNNANPGSAMHWLLSAARRCALTLLLAPLVGTLSVQAQTPPAMTWQYGYDAMGRINTLVNPSGHATYVYYDSLGRPIQTQQPPNEGTSSPTVVEYGYNPANDLTQVRDPRNLLTTYSLNGLGERTGQSSPDTGSTLYTRDANGNVLTSTDARGKTTTYTYDNLNRPTSISYPTGVATTLEYDGGSSPTPAALGELTKMTDESGQTTYSHDALGRVTTKTTVISGQSFTTGYGWGDSGSALDKLTSITYPSGSRVNYSYDAQGYVSAISVNPVNANGVGTSASSVSLLTGIGYNAQNQISGWLWSDGKARSIGYDAYGQVSSYNLGDPVGAGNKAGVLRTLTRDAAGRITGYSHTNNGTAVGSLDQGFAYDKLDRLLSASLGASSMLYSYDTTGNRTSKTIASTTYSNTIASNSNRLTQSQDINGTSSISHDAAGHMTVHGGQTLNYSDRGRLSSVVMAAGTVSHLYNGYGQRVHKSGPGALVPTGEAHYLYDEGGQLLGEYDASGHPLYETVYLGALPVGVIRHTGSAAGNDLAATLYNVHADQIATARVITQQDQTIVWRWDTAEAFGGALPDQDPSALGVFTFNQRFPGQVFDADSGLLQNWNREYNARLGRYMQSDPIGLEGGINTFAYVDSNPLLYVDDDGLTKKLPSLKPDQLRPLPTGGGGLTAAGKIQPIPFPPPFRSSPTTVSLTGQQCSIATTARGVTKPGGYSVVFETTIAKTGAGTREAHKALANKELAAAIAERNLGPMLSSLGVNPVRGAATPSGFRWHHAPDRPGVMQLVPEAQHTAGSSFQDVLHPGGSGGFAQWGRDW